MPRKYCKSLKHSKWTPKITNLHINDFMVYVEHRKKIICKQWRYVNYLSKFMRFPLKTTKLHRRWFDLWTLYMVTVSKPSQIFTTALWSQVMAPCQIWTDSDVFFFFLFSKRKSPVLSWFDTIFFHVALLIFLTYGIHMWRRP